MPLYDTTEPDAPSPKAETLIEAIVTKETATVYTNNNVTGSDFEIDGYNWPVTFYSQILAADDSPRRLDLHLSPTLQQYVKINNLLVVADDEPDPSTDLNTITTLEGIAKIYPSVIPNPGDMFIGNLRDGRSALFVVTHVVRQGYLSGSVREITYQMVDYLSDVYSNNLDIKVVKELYFDKETKLCDNGLKSTVSLGEVYASINMVATRLWDEYYDLLAQSLIVKIGESRMYDHSVNSFIAKIIPYQIYKTKPNIIEYNIPSNRYSKVYNTLWDVMAHGSFAQFEFVSRNALVMSRSEFIATNIYSSVGHAQIDAVIHPSMQPSLYGASTEDYGTGYIFSEYFYSNQLDRMTTLEKLVGKSIRGETASYADIITELRGAINDSSSKRFYKLAIILWLLIRLT
jgi:hypothetical protein